MDDPTTGHRPVADGETMVDVRGPRFGAAVTTVVLAAALVVQGPVGTLLVAWQVLAFGLATFLGLRWSPYGRLFRLVQGSFGLGPPSEVEPSSPPRFAQLCGFAVAGGGLVALLLGAATLGWVLVGIVLALSTLLATTGLCIGCELYLLGVRLRRSTPA